MIEVPADSIYFWMYEQGLKHIDLNDIALACQAAGKIIRAKDEENYWNGWYRSDLYSGAGKDDVFRLVHRDQQRKGASQEFFSSSYAEYPTHPYPEDRFPEIGNRWVPCDKNNKPMIKWGNGCMSLADAVAYKEQKYLAENLKGTKFIVIDCDGNHGETVDAETVCFLNRWRDETHTIVKPNCVWKGLPLSFHLTFKVDRIIPTMHFPYAHIDVVGNRRNSLRYWKNKEWNHKSPAVMTEQRWSEFQKYLEYRKEKAHGHESL